MTNPLLQLKDLKLPAAPGIWPLAYGWYFVFFALLLLITGAVWIYWRRQARLKPIKKALLELDDIYLKYQQENCCVQTSHQLLVLVKRFLFFYHPRKKVASLYGDDFYKLLGSPFWLKELATISYQKESDLDMKPLFDAVRQWIREGQYATL